jgi:hypothetical protein
VPGEDAGASVSGGSLARLPRRVIKTVIVAVAAFAAASPNATAHDSLAPQGAPHRWLPVEEWVFRHWVPFDERALTRALRLRGHELRAYLYNDHHTLAALARRRGIGLNDLVAKLLEPWGASVSQRERAVLRDHTVRLLTQGHLAQHVLFHSFHTVGLEAATRRLFGVTHTRFRALRRQRNPPLAIARRHGIPERTVTYGLGQVFRANQAAGVSRHQAWPAQATRMVRRQLAELPCWLRRPRPAADRGNPFGKATLQHGVHAAEWPSTPLQQRNDQRSVERVRRSLQPSCWRRPGAWNRSAADPEMPPKTPDTPPRASIARPRPPVRPSNPITHDLHCVLSGAER